MQSTDWQSRLVNLEKWLNVSSSTTPLFLRLLGLVLVISGVFQISSLTLYPYLVSPWSIYGQPLEIPRWPLVADLLIYCIYFGCAACLIFGIKNRIPLTLAAIIFISTVSREIVAITSNFQYILLTYVIAALFAYNKRSCTARLVQMSLSSCYLFAVIHKLSPEFLGGHTLWAMFVDGWGLRKFWVPVVQFINPPIVLMQVLSILAIATEGFLAVGLWFKRTRRAAVLVGIALHLTLSLFLTIIDYASVVMLLGYIPLWGMESKKPAAEPETPAAQASLSAPPADFIQTALALFVGIAITLSPLRYYFAPLNFLPTPYLDSNIGTFGMFAEKQEIDKVEINEKVANQIKPVAVVGRMSDIKSESDVLLLARYLVQRTPDLEELKAVISINVNNRWTKYLTFIAQKDKDGFVVKRQEQLVRRNPSLPVGGIEKTGD